MSRNRVDLSSDLIVLGARLVRQVRRYRDLPAGTRLLALLDEQGPLSIGTIAEADGSSQPTISASVAHLERLGYVDRASDPDDGRRSVITLTERGATALSEVRARNGAWAADLLRDHTTDELDTAIAVLRTLTEGDR